MFQNIAKVSPLQVVLLAVCVRACVLVCEAKGKKSSKSDAYNNKKEERKKKKKEGKAENYPREGRPWKYDGWSKARLYNLGLC